MEHTSRGAVIPLDARWNDVGSWTALWEVKEKDDGGLRIPRTHLYTVKVVL